MRAAIALSREGLARVRVRPRRGRRAALARWQGRVSAVSHMRPNHSALELFFCDFSAARPRFVARLARSDSPHSRGLARVRIRPRRGRRAALARWQGRVSVVSHTRRTSLHEPRHQYTAICYCCWTSCRTASLKPLNNIIQLPLHVPCIISSNYTAIGSGLYICLLYTSPSPRDKRQSRMPSSA